MDDHFAVEPVAVVREHAAEAPLSVDRHRPEVGRQAVGRERVGRPAGLALDGDALELELGHLLGFVAVVADVEGDDEPALAGGGSGGVGQRPRRHEKGRRQRCDAASSDRGGHAHVAV